MQPAASGGCANIVHMIYSFLPKRHALAHSSKHFLSGAGAAAYLQPTAGIPCRSASTSAAPASFKAQISLRELEGSLLRPLTGNTKAQLLRLSDLRTPQDWYPTARRMRRKVILHVGPTNSGKTHSALVRLRESRNGMYCGPLRLLAWEIHERLNESGTACDLVTGQEREYAADSKHVSCTVEMADVSRPMEVVVLDEIQMLGDDNRGWAWTRVLLGAAADEIHCCGDPAAVPLVTAICKLTGDELIIKEYKRLSPLKVADAHVRSVSDLKRGDVVVAFSRRRLYEWKRQIESKTGLRVGMIYGALPPAVRREQAKRFNAGAAGTASSVPGSRFAESSSSIDLDSDCIGPATDILCASDAVGMGLNLAIGRVIFTDIQKFDGTGLRRLTVSELKQIGGRAGRYGSVYPTGFVSSLSKQHQGIVRQALVAASATIPTAFLQPTLEHLEAFTASLASNVLHESLLRELSILADDDSEDELTAAAVMGEQADREDEASSTADDSELSDGNSTGSDGPSSSESEEDVPDLSSLVGSLQPSQGVQGYRVPRHISLLADAVTEVVPFSLVLTTFAACAASADKRSLYTIEPTRSSGSDDDDDGAFGDSGTYRRRPLFKLAGSLEGSMMETARLLDDVALPFRHRWSFCQAPVDTNDKLVVQALRRYGNRFVSKGRVRVGLRVPPYPPSTPWELEELESAHAVFDLYTWLARKFPTEFIDLDAAQAAAIATQALISEGLERIGALAVAEGLEKRAAEEEKQRQADRRALQKATRKADRKLGRRLGLDLSMDGLDSEDLMTSQYLRSMVDGVGEQTEQEGTLYPRPKGSHNVSANKRRGKEPVEQVSSGAPYAPYREKESSRSQKRAREEKQSEKKLDRKRLRAARRLAEGMMYAAAETGKLNELKHDPTWVDLMEKVTQKGKHEAKGWGRGWNGRSGKGLQDQPLPDVPIR